MGDIFVPVPLSNLEAILKALEPIFDPLARKKISDDIMEFHVLNATESKKAEDARVLIKQHKAILDETKKIADKNELNSALIIEDRKKFNVEMIAEREKLKAEKNALTHASQDALTLHNEALAMKINIESKEAEIKKQREAYALDVLRFVDKQEALAIEYEKVADIKKQHTELLESIRSKDEAIRKIVSR